MVCLISDFEYRSHLSSLFSVGILTYMPLNRENVSYLRPSLVVPAEDAQLTPLLRLGAGACAGIIAMSATYPMDMVRGRLTVQV